LPTFASSPRALPLEWCSEGRQVRRFRDQLAVVLGKSHTVEFAFGGLGISAHWPIPWNPQNRKIHYSPGGSSSGARVTLGGLNVCILVFCYRNLPVRRRPSLPGSKCTVNPSFLWTTGHPESGLSQLNDGTHAILGPLTFTLVIQGCV
jgi:hypothetical protein